MEGRKESPERDVDESRNKKLTEITFYLFWGGYYAIVNCPGQNLEGLYFNFWGNHAQLMVNFSTMYSSSCGQEGFGLFACT